MRRASDPIDSLPLPSSFFDVARAPSPAKGADFYRGAVRSRDPQTIVIRSQLYRLRFAFTEEYGKKIDIDFRFGNRVV